MVVFTNFFVRAPPEKADDLMRRMDEERPLKEARTRLLVEHNPHPPFLPSIDGMVQLKQNLTKRSIDEMLGGSANDDAIETFKQPACKPPPGAFWTAKNMHDFVNRGDQPIFEWEQYGTMGPSYGVQRTVLSTNGAEPRQGKRTDIDEMHVRASHHSVCVRV